MADSSSPEPQDAAAPSALTPSFDTTTAPDVATAAETVPDSDQAAGVAVVRRGPAPGRKPLPDAVAIRLVVVPDSAPAYDDAPRGAPGGRPPGQAPRGAPGGDAADVGGAIAAASRVPAACPGQGQFAGHWPSQFAQVLAETLAGSRPPGQLVPWTTRQTRRRISQLGPVLSTAHRPRVRRVIVTSPAGGVLEMAVIVGVGTRVRALAVRLERTPAPPAGEPSSRHKPADHPGWICTAIEAA